MSQYYREKHYSDATDFLKALSLLFSELGLDGFIYRGHSNDEEYKLIPSALRLENLHKLYEYAGNKIMTSSMSINYHHSEVFQTQIEFKILRDFYRLADKRGLVVPQSQGIRTYLAYERDMYTPLSWLLKNETHWIPDDILDIAALAQHYGLYTRLMDWSYDPYVAAFFAASSEKVHDGCLSVWCLNKEGMGMLNATMPESSLKFIVPPYSTNPNLHAQSGIFTHWPTTIEPHQDLSKPSTLQSIDRTPLDVKVLKIIEQSLESESVYTPQGIQLMKLTLPASESTSLLRILRSIGYGHSKIFPGYSGVASEIMHNERLGHP